MNAQTVIKGGKYLTEVDQHIEEATAKITDLRTQIAVLEREAHDTETARATLEIFEGSLELMKDYRSMIVRTLELVDPPQNPTA
jgi:hypothetical protein